MYFIRAAARPSETQALRDFPSPDFVCCAGRKQPSSGRDVAEFVREEAGIQIKVFLSGPLNRPWWIAGPVGSRGSLEPVKDALKGLNKSS